MTQEIKSFLKWSGNKQSIADVIQCQFPVQFSRYIEPLVGGGSVFLSLPRQLGRQERIGDANSWLTDTYRGLRDSYDRVVAILESMTLSKAVYTRIRRVHPNDLAPEYKAAHLIYLNQLCFANMFRVNRQGYFNVSFDGHGLTKVFNSDHLRQVHERLQGVEIYTGDFVNCISQAQAGDFVYFDPPGKGSSFFGATGSSGDTHNFYGFNDHDYHRLSRWCRDLDLRGVSWAVSDTNTPMMRLLFSQYHRTTLTVDPWDLEIKSLLFTNYVIPEKHGNEELQISEAISQE